MGVIRKYLPSDRAACESVLRALPDWFGIEQSIVDYVEALPKYDTYVYVVAERVLGFVTLQTHNIHSSEMHVLGVLQAHHGQGIGGALVRHVEEEARNRGQRFLQVKTLGPSHRDPHYAGTRRFYEHMGYAPLEETNLWGDRNPCLIMVKAL